MTQRTPGPTHDRAAAARAAQDRDLVGMRRHSRKHRRQYGAEAPSTTANSRRDPRAGRAALPRAGVSLDQECFVERDSARLAATRGQALRSEAIGIADGQ